MTSAKNPQETTKHSAAKLFWLSEDRWHLLGTALWGGVTISPLIGSFSESWFGLNPQQDASLQLQGFYGDVQCLSDCVGHPLMAIGVDGYHLIFDPVSSIQLECVIDAGCLIWATIEGHVADPASPLRGKLIHAKSAKIQPPLQKPAAATIAVEDRKTALIRAITFEENR